MSLDVMCFLLVSFFVTSLGFGLISCYCICILSICIEVHMIVIVRVWLCLRECNLDFKTSVVYSSSLLTLELNGFCDLCLDMCFLVYEIRV